MAKTFKQVNIACDFEDTLNLFIETNCNCQDHQIDDITNDAKDTDDWHQVLGTDKIQLTKRLFSRICDLHA